MLARRSVLIGVCGALVAGPARAGFAYRGWNLDTSEIDGPLPDALVLSLQAQIDLVEALPWRPRVLSFFRSEDVKVDPSTLGKPALYRAQRGSDRHHVTMHRIYITTRPLPPDAPVLLRMLLLAYLDRRVSYGWRNKQLKAWWEGARRSAAFAPQSNLLESPEQFFAIGAEVILRGRAREEPFYRAKVREKLPLFYAWTVAELCDDGVVLD